jgi:hypothetical protein
VELNTENDNKSAFTVILRNDIMDDVAAVQLLETILSEYGYKKTHYKVIKGNSNVRLEIEDDDTKKLDTLVNQFWDQELLASNEKDFLSFF